MTISQKQRITQKNPLLQDEISFFTTVSVMHHLLPFYRAKLIYAVLYILFIAGGRGDTAAMERRAYCLYIQKETRPCHLWHQQRNFPSFSGGLLYFSGVSLPRKAKILLTRLNKYIVDRVCPESQCGFRREHGTVDMVFMPRQLQEKCREQNRNM